MSAPAVTSVRSDGVGRITGLLARTRGEVIATSGTDTLGADLTSVALRQVEGGLLRRGVAVRRLYTPDALADLDDDGYLDRFVSAGGQVRVLPGALSTILMIDRRVAVLRAGDLPAPDYVVLQASALSRAIGNFCDHAWQAAASWDAYQNRPQCDDDVQARVLAALAAGHKDVAAAKLLDMSVRTYRRHVAQVMRQLGVTSRFAAGAQAARLGLLPPEG